MLLWLVCIWIASCLIEFYSLSLFHIVAFDRALSELKLSICPSLVYLPATSNSSGSSPQGEVNFSRRTLSFAFITAYFACFNWPHNLRATSEEYSTRSYNVWMGYLGIPIREFTKPNTLREKLCLVKWSDDFLILKPLYSKSEAKYSIANHLWFDAESFEMSQLEGKVCSHQANNRRALKRINRRLNILKMTTWQSVYSKVSIFLLIFTHNNKKMSWINRESSFYNHFILSELSLANWAQFFPNCLLNYNLRDRVKLGSLRVNTFFLQKRFFCSETKMARGWNRE